MANKPANQGWEHFQIGTFLLIPYLLGITKMKGYETLKIRQSLQYPSFPGVIYKI